MRITSGIHRGRVLKVPERQVRPTTDMVREALFSIIGLRILEARFLDLFAGSGAVGLEAWSRGAGFVQWVEQNRRTFGVLKQNIETLCTERMDLVSSDVFRFLQRPPTGAPFRIIFADPPYDRDGKERWLARLLEAIPGSGRLAEDGLFIMEQEIREPGAEHPLWNLIDERTYGHTRLRFFVRKP